MVDFGFNDINLNKIKEDNTYWGEEALKSNLNFDSVKDFFAYIRDTTFVASQNDLLLDNINQLDNVTAPGSYSISLKTGDGLLPTLNGAYDFTLNVMKANQDGSTIIQQQIYNRKIFQRVVPSTQWTQISFGDIEREIFNRLVARVDIYDTTGHYLRDDSGLYKIGIDNTTKHPVYIQVNPEDGSYNTQILATRTWVNNTLTSYATETWVLEQIADLISGGGIDLSDYVTKDELEEALANYENYWKLDEDDNVYTEHNVYSTGGITAYGIGSGGTGGGGAGYIGELFDVVDSATGSTTYEVVLTRKANSELWSIKPLSEIVGLDTTALQNYLTTYNYITRADMVSYLLDYVRRDEIDDIIVTILSKWFKEDGQGNLYTEWNFYSTKGITAYGVGSGSSSGGGGSNYDRLDNWTDYDSTKEGYVLSAKLGYGLYTSLNSVTSRVTSLETSSSNTITRVGNLETNLTALTGRVTSVESVINGLATNYVTIATAQTISAVKVFSSTVYHDAYVHVGSGKTSATDGVTGITLASTGNIILTSNPGIGNQGNIIQFCHNGATSATSWITERLSGNLQIAVPNGLRVGASTTSASTTHRLYIDGSTYSSDTIHGYSAGIAFIMRNTATFRIYSSSGVSQDVIRMNADNDLVFGTGNYNDGTRYAYYRGGRQIVFQTATGGDIRFLPNNILHGRFTSTGLSIGTTKSTVSDGILGFKFHVDTATTMLGITGSSTVAPEIRFFNANATSWTARILSRGVTPSTGQIVINSHLSVRATSDTALNTAYRLSVDGTAYFADYIHTTNRIRVGDIWLEYDATNNALRIYNNDSTKYANFYASGGITAYGVGEITGGGPGVAYDRLDNWTDYDSTKEGYVLSAKLGYGLYTSVTSLDNRIDGLEGVLLDLSNGYVTTNTTQRIIGQKTFATRTLFSSDTTTTTYGDGTTSTSIESGAAIVLSTSTTTTSNPRIIFYRAASLSYRIEEAYQGILSLRTYPATGTYGGLYISQSELKTNAFPTTTTRLMVNGSIYSVSTIYISNANKTSTTDGLTGTILSQGYIELQTGDTNGGYIDFHYGTTTTNYTSRIIESAEGAINLVTPNGVRIGTDQANVRTGYQLYVSGNSYFNNVMYISNTSKAGSADGLRGITMHVASPYITIDTGLGLTDAARIRFVAGADSSLTQFTNGYPGIMTISASTNPGLYIGTAVRTTALTFTAYNGTVRPIAIHSTGNSRYFGRTYFTQPIFISSYDMGEGSDGSAGVYVESTAPRITLSRGTTQGTNTNPTRVGFSWSGTAITSYLTETTSGTVSIYSRLYVNSSGNSYNLYVNGTSYLNGNTTIAGNLTFTSGVLSIWADLIFQTTGANKGIYANRATTSNVLYFYLGNASSTTEARYVMSTTNFRPDGTALGSTVGNSFHPNLGSVANYWQNTYTNVLWVGGQGKSAYNDGKAGLLLSANSTQTYLTITGQTGQDRGPYISFYYMGATTETNRLIESYSGILSITNSLHIGGTRSTAFSNSVKFMVTGNSWVTSTAYFANSTNYYFNSSGNIGLNQSLTFYTGSTNHYINSVGQVLSICIGTAGSTSSQGSFVFTSTQFYPGTTANMYLGASARNWVAGHIVTVYTGTGKYSTADGLAGCVVGPGYISITGNPNPYIQFYNVYGTSVTTTIRESYSGILSIANAYGLYLGTSVRDTAMSYRLWVNGTSYYSSIAYFQGYVHVGSGKTSATDGVTGITLASTGNIILTSNPGIGNQGNIIQFCHNGATSATSWITERLSGNLQIAVPNGLRVGASTTSASTTHRLYIDGSTYFNGATYTVSSATFASTTTTTGIATFNNSATNAVYIPNGSLRIGNGVLRWDNTNRAFYVQYSDGSAANFYASGGITAYGLVGASTEWQIGSLVTTGNLTVGGATTTTGLITANGNIRTTRLGVNVGISTSYQAYISGITYITGNTYIGGVNSSYRLYVSGNTYIAGTFTYTGTSDRKLKTDIQEVTGTLDKLKQIKVYSFRYNDTAKEVFGNITDERHYGLMYDEVNKVLPETTILNLEYGHIKYLDYIPLLVSVALELNKNYETMQEKIDRLEKEVEQLKSQLCQ